MAQSLSIKQKLLLKALEETFYVVTEACKRTNIPRRTYYNWMKKEEFRKEAKKIEEDLLTRIEDLLKVAALERQPWAIKFFLSRRHPEYKQKVQLEEKQPFPYEINLKVLPKQEEEKQK